MEGGRGRRGGGGVGRRGGGGRGYDLEKLALVVAMVVRCLDGSGFP